MRFSLPAALLFAGALATSGLAVSGCSASPDEPDADDQAALGDDELNAVNNKMGLRLVYDAPTTRVRATLKAKLQTGERLMLRVRRGRIAVEAMSSVDCSQLAIATPLVPTPRVTSKTVYVGPEMDPTLLVNVYKQEWIDQNISAQTIERLSRDGADAIVDACIVREEAVRARLQTSLQYAWDTTDPHIAPALVHGP
jgi:hypothetical protein